MDSFTSPSAPDGTSGGQYSSTRSSLPAASSGAAEGQQPEGEAPGASGQAATPRQQPQGSSMYDLFLTAIGLTPPGLGAETFSPGGSGVEAEEEEFWSATNEEEKIGGVPSGGGGVVAESSRSGMPPRRQEQQQPAVAAGGGAGTESGDNDNNNDVPIGGACANSYSSVSAVAGVRGRGTTFTYSSASAVAGLDGRDTMFNSVAGSNRSAPAAGAQRPSAGAEIARTHPGEASDGQDASVDTAADAMCTATGAEGTARRRRRLLGSNAAVGPESDARASRSRTFSATTPRLFRRGNPLFRSGDIGSFWRSNVFAGNATFDDENDVEEDAAGTGTRAVERAVNGTSAVTAAATGGHAATAVADVERNDRVAGCNSLDSTERGEGGDGGGQGRILFYHKPTLANVPAGDIPDVVPVYLGCPRGNMALGLPLDEAWQGEEHQDTTFNQNLSYTILSWPEDHVQDLLELWRLQVLFFATIIFNILVSALLFFTENPDRTRVEGFARSGAFPRPFEQRSPTDDPTGLRSEASVAPRGCVGPQPSWHRVRVGSIAGGHCALPRADRRERRRRPEPLPRPSVRVPLRHRRFASGDGPIVFVLAFVHVGHRLRRSWAMGLVV
ncbi:unnamed protein product [Ectocarpus sp. CCAP 1310/34]|nr:unnamed protein product [Ectocarpus sp. CCAP 1310/34]